MKGFWNDGDGLTVVEILAITLGLGSAGLYWRFGCLDSNFADIVVASILGAAGQRVGYKWANGRSRICNEGDNVTQTGAAGQSQQVD